MNRIMIHTRLYCFFLLLTLVACHAGVDTRVMDFNQLRIDKTFVDEMRLTEDQKMDAKIGTHTLHQMLLEGDFLPSGWVADPPPRFYELKRVERGNNQVLLFYAVCFEEERIAEIKVATLEGAKLQYNYLIWSNVEYGDPYTLIQLDSKNSSIHFYHEGELRFTYQPDQGKVEMP